jgi:hypothetical protein
MHRFGLRFGFVSVVACAAGAGWVGCFPFKNDCEVIRTCVSFSSGPSGSGGDGGTNPACVPSENNGPVSDDCGVFVATSGKDGNEGTKESPVATLAKAVELAEGKSRRVYACAEMFEEALVLDVAVEMLMETC